jgi:hypothetical protein
MSIEIVAKIICDTCGASITGEIERSATFAKNAYWNALAKAQKSHWLMLPRYGKHKHLCQSCADGVPKPPFVAKQ